MQLELAESKAASEVEALLARDTHQQHQLEQLHAEVGRLRGAGGAQAPLSDDAFEEVG